MIICRASGQFVVVSSCREIGGRAGYCRAVSCVLQLHLRAGAGLLDYLSQAFLIRQAKLREDLNPIEEALAYQRLMQEFSLKQEEIAERVSKNRTTITNCMRLLNLVPEVQQMLIEGRITSGHARALLAVTDPSQQIDLAKKVEQERMSVREVEKAVKLLGKEKKEKKKTLVDEAVELVFQDMENRMKTVMGTKVNISRKDKSKGKIEIEYYSEAELERLVELIESIQPV